MFKRLQNLDLAHENGFSIGVTSGAESLAREAREENFGFWNVVYQRSVLAGQISR